jgi:murein DD-endopeptidase MepM/ murein hydrolase activator NlpD
MQVFVHETCRGCTCSVPCYGDRLLNPPGSREKAPFGPVDTEPAPATDVSLHRLSTRAVGATLALSLICVAAGMLTSSSPMARAAASGQLPEQISAGQSHVARLGSAVSAATTHLSELASSISMLERRVASIQSDLDAKRSELLRLRGALVDATTRLVALEAAAARADEVLSRQLISAYETDQFDIVSVVLEATGFNDLLERLSFAQRIENQDVRIVSQARAARRAVAAQATRLGALNARQQTLTTQALNERNSLDRATVTLLRRRIAVSHMRTAAAGQLVDARDQVTAGQQQLSRLEAAQAAAPAAPAGTATDRSAGSSGGGFVFPMPKPDAAPPGTWTLDQGVDIAAPGGTPLLAVGSGTVVLHGIGGFGPSAPVLHLDSGPYVYYGHAGPGNWVAVGTHVNAGQVISEVGYGIVGISSGSDLELGFADSSGSPIGSSTAPHMMSLLHAAYAG